MADLTGSARPRKPHASPRKCLRSTGPPALIRHIPQNALHCNITAFMRLLKEFNMPPRRQSPTPLGKSRSGHKLSRIASDIRCRPAAFAPLSAPVVVGALSAKLIGGGGRGSGYVSPSSPVRSPRSDRGEYWRPNNNNQARLEACGPFQPA
jgi:hypothetical protein